MIALPNGSFVRSDAITAVSLLEESNGFLNRVVVHHNGVTEVIPLEDWDQAQELAAEISRQCDEERTTWTTLQNP